MLKHFGNISFRLVLDRVSGLRCLGARPPARPVGSPATRQPSGNRNKPNRDTSVFICIPDSPYRSPSRNTISSPPVPETSQGRSGISLHGFRESRMIINIPRREYSPIGFPDGFQRQESRNSLQIRQDNRVKAALYLPYKKAVRAGWHSTAFSFSTEKPNR